MRRRRVLFDEPWERVLTTTKSGRTCPGPRPPAAATPAPPPATPPAAAAPTRRAAGWAPGTASSAYAPACSRLQAPLSAASARSGGCQASFSPPHGRRPDAAGGTGAGKEAHDVELAGTVGAKDRNRQEILHVHVGRRPESPDADTLHTRVRSVVHCRRLPSRTPTRRAPPIAHRRRASGKRTGTSRRQSIAPPCATPGASGRAAAAFVPGGAPDTEPRPATGLARRTPVSVPHLPGHAGTDRAAARSIRGRIPERIGLVPLPRVRSRSRSSGRGRTIG